MSGNASIRRRLILIVVGMTLIIVMAVAFIALSGSREFVRDQVISTIIERNPDTCQRSRWAYGGGGCNYPIIGECAHAL